MSPARKGWLAVVVLVLAAGALWLLGGRGEAPVEDGAHVAGAATDGRLRVAAPGPGAVVSSPLSVRGEARGPWYFEADFPVRLLDAEGRELAVTPARAEGEWMTEGFVPFGATLPFGRPGTRTGLVVLERANPSGLSENAALAAVPVRFDDDAPLSTAVRVFFHRTGSDDESCEAVWPVARAVRPTGEKARAALEELLEGPSPAERDRGYVSSLPDGVGLRSLRLEDGVIRADFDSALNRAAGSCRVLAIRTQIERTLLRAHRGVERVIISVEGSVDRALQP